MVGHNDGSAMPRKSGKSAPSFEELLSHALANTHGIPVDQHKDSMRKMSEMASDVSDYTNRLEDRVRREGPIPSHMLTSSDKWLTTFYQVLQRMLREVLACDNGEK